MAESRLKIGVTGAISSNKHLNEAVSAANTVLIEVIGSGGSSVCADWSLRKDEKDRTLVILKLRDHTGEVEVKFAPDELKHPRKRLQGAWDGLLAGSSS